MNKLLTDKTDNKLREWTREINRGFLEFWVLNLLRKESLYGARIGTLIEEMSEGRIQLEPGTIYPLLNRLADNGWIKGDVKVRSEGRGPMRRYYRLTNDGKLLLSAMIDHYFDTYDALFQLMAAEFQSVRKRLFELMEEID
ncbi:MAG: PadR family transcriptional regulator [Candidatus Thorarchaeota archaeon]